MVHFHNLRPISKSEHKSIPADALERELPKVEPQTPSKAFTTPAPKVAPAVHDTYDAPTQSFKPVSQEPAPLEKQYFDEPATISMPEISEPKLEEKPLDIYEETSVQETSEEILDVGDLSLDVFEEEPAPSAPVKQEIPTVNTEPAVKKEVVQKEWDNGYHYNPHIASKELGLPLDLIEEFIQDFIAQAKEFKSGIYSSIEEGDADNVKILSHKLKGVAANLRIEDAHEVLSAVSATNDIDVIHENLDTFYKIIAKLAGEPVEQVIVVEEEIIQENPVEEVAEDDDEISLAIDEEEQIEIVDIEDEDVPQKIEMPELADDDFLEIGSDAIDDDITIQESPAEEEVHFSKAQAAQEIGISEESFNELFDDFVNESHTILQKMNNAIANDNLQTCPRSQQYQRWELKLCN